MCVGRLMPYLVNCAPKLPLPVQKRALLAAKGSDLAKRSVFPSVEGDEIPSCLSSSAVTISSAVRCDQILSA